MGERFWEFLETVGEKLEPVLKQAGYKYKKTNYIYSFCVIEYEFFVE